MAKSAQVQKVSWWHQQIVDWEIMNPHRTLNDCAAFFNVGPAWLSTVRNSDAFKAYAASRYQTHSDKVSTDVIGKVEKVAALSLDVLHERIQRERKEIGLEGVLDTASMALKSLGFGVPKAAPVGNVTNNTQINVVDSQTLAAARERMRVQSGSAMAEQLAAPAIGDQDVLPPPPFYDAGGQENGERKELSPAT